MRKGFKLMHPALINELSLPGYCNHIHEIHDGQTRWALADIEEYRTKRSTVQLYRFNYYKEPDAWELMWDLTRDEAWSAERKPALGHSLALGPKSLIVSVPWKGIGAADGTAGSTSFSFLRDQIPAMQP